MKKIYVTALLAALMASCSAKNIKEKETVQVDVQPVSKENVQELEVVPAKQYKWKCVGCNIQEEMALKAFQDRAYHS